MRCNYIVVYRGVYIEIQIKTLFEEGWGEIDHSILYPQRKGNAMLTEFSELLNRLAGMGDEMGSFYQPSARLCRMRSSRARKRLCASVN